MNPGIHLVHKPVGPTSFSALREIAAREPRLKMCHGGVLDPFASGLLLILAGEATKLFDYLHDIPKVYEATIRWGVETDSGDPLGRVVASSEASIPSAGRLDAALRATLGWLPQVPPATSNKRVGGERAYVRAHRGEDVQLPPSRVYLHAADWMDDDHTRLRVIVRGGFYVRSLVRDLGRRLGCGAHLAALHRSAIGPWNDPKPQSVVEIRGAELLPWLQSRKLTDQEVGELRAGRAVAMGSIEAATWYPPKGFPGPGPYVRGFHRDRLSFVLVREQDRLRAKSSLYGGV
jgi:tRNA pseudouridine55 synthase